MTPTNSSNGVKLAIGLGISALCCLGLAFSIVKAEQSAFRLLDLPPNWSAAVLFFVAGSGWTVLVLNQLVPFLTVIAPKQKFRQQKMTSNEALQLAKSADVIRIFASGSETYRTFLQNNRSSLQSATEIRVLMRSDGSLGRDDVLLEDAKKWMSNIAGGGVSVIIHSVVWSPMMYRGWVFDCDTAILGWYYRGKGVTQGQTDPSFLIEDRVALTGIVRMFDDLFAYGSKVI